MTNKLSVVAVMMMSVGCAKTESDDLLTSGIYADLEAHATGNGKTTVSATLYVDSPVALNFVELGDDDHLVVTSGSDSQTLVESELGNIVSHTASFSADAGGTSFDIAFQRQLDAGAPSSKIVLPPAFTPDPPPATASRMSPLKITWSPSGSDGEMRWTAAGTCIENAAGESGGDIGNLIVPAGILAKRTGTGIADSCTLTFQMSLQRTGTLDAHYGKGGVVFGSQDRTITWTTTP